MVVECALSSGNAFQHRELYGRGGTDKLCVWWFAESHMSRYRQRLPVWHVLNAPSIAPQKVWAVNPSPLRAKLWAEKGANHASKGPRSPQYFPESGLTSRASPSKDRVGSHPTKYGDGLADCARGHTHLLPCRAFLCINAVMLLLSSTMLSLVLLPSCLSCFVFAMS
jgi:hypothetical protein